jgi:hypothetical protein
VLLFDAANSGIVGGLSLILTVCGLLLSLVGFIYTIKQVKRTLTAAEAAKLKADELRNQVGVFDLSLEISRANNSLKQVLAFVRSKNLQLTLTPLEDAQAHLNRISKLLVEDRDISSTARQDSAFFLSQIQIIDDSLEKNIGFDSVDLVTRARKTINTLDSKLIDFQKGLYDA